jgi:hypothetical protein
MKRIKNSLCAKCSYNKKTCPHGSLVFGVDDFCHEFIPKECRKENIEESPVEETYKFDPSLYKPMEMLVQKDRKTGVLIRTPEGELLRAEILQKKIIDKISGDLDDEKD